MQTEVIIKDVNVHPQTGHITVRVFTKTTDGGASWTGPEKDYGVDANHFAGHLNGDVEQLKKWILNQHQAYTGVHMGLVGELAKLKGQVIG